MRRASWHGHSPPPLVMSSKTNTCGSTTPWRGSGDPSLLLLGLTPRWLWPRRGAGGRHGARSRHGPSVPPPWPAWGRHCVAEPPQVVAQAGQGATGVVSASREYSSMEDTDN